MASTTTTLSDLIFGEIEWDNSYVGISNRDPQEPREVLRFSDEVTVRCDLATFLYGFDDARIDIRVNAFDAYLAMIGSVSQGGLTMYARLERAAIAGESVVAVFSIRTE